MTTTSTEEIEHFERDAPHWWDESGPFASLHRLNPVRLTYIKRQICAHFGRDAGSMTALKGLKILDTGCGGGLVCEPLARLGGSVTGLDAGSTAISVARSHAAESALDITYREGMIADAPSRSFDCVLALEILEHVDDPAIFVHDCLRAGKPGGLVIFSTLNRTLMARLLGIYMAEYVLRWVPRGTHQWEKFMRPSELAACVRYSGGRVTDVCGMVFRPDFEGGGFGLDPEDVSVNYLMSATL